MRIATRTIALGLSSLVLAAVVAHLTSSSALTQQSSPAAKVRVSPPATSASFIAVSSNEFRTSSATVTINVTTEGGPNGNGNIALFVNSSRQKTNDTGGSRTLTPTVDLNEGQNTINVEWTLSGGGKAVSNTLLIQRDTVGPMLQHAEVIDTPASGITLVVTFADDDLDRNTAGATAFTVLREDKDGGFAGQDTVTIQGTPVVAGRTIRLAFAALPASQYQLKVKGNVLKDAVGNFAGGNASSGSDKQWLFSVLTERKFGEHIEFPPYAPAKKQNIPPEGFNPADYVTTRVARLYYYRDAHRVAQIINRNIRSYNQAAVDQAERRAEQARDEANDATDERRTAEREAVRAAEAARNAEIHLANTREVQSIAEDVEARIKTLQGMKSDIEGRLTELNRLEETARQDDVNASQAEQQARTTGQTADAARLKANKAAADVMLAMTKLNQAKTDAAAGRPAPDIRNLEQDLDQKRKLASDAAVEADSFEATAASNQQTATALRQKADQSRSAAVAKAAVIQSDKLKADLVQIEADIAQLTDRKNKIGASSSYDATVAQMEQAVANLRQTEIAKQEAWDESEAKEARAREKQFREEVAAAEEDPDTYVAGDIHSVDPVTQVSVSVIGEGLLQLRGPIKGINKIRTMINQIDSPVGQIKNGILTVQVNGEKGDRMERVVGRIEGHIDLGRFLTNQSLSLLRRAIQTEAAMIAEQCDQGGHYQVDRDRKYLYAFFGRDFIDELYAMDSEFLRSENKLLSLHSMDTISLNRALFVLALAKNDVRERILVRFLESTKTDLADAEYDFRRSSELRPHTTQKLIPIPTATHLPFWNRYHVEEITYEAVHRNAMQRYHFRNLRGFFDAGFGTENTMNPMQREFIKLAQIFKSRMVAELELTQRVMERALIEDRSNDDKALYDAMQPAHEAAIRLAGDAYMGRVTADQQLREAFDNLRDLPAKFDEMRATINTINKERQPLTDLYRKLSDNRVTPEQERELQGFAARIETLVADALAADWVTTEDKTILRDTQDGVVKRALDKSREVATGLDAKGVTDSLFPAVVRTENVLNARQKEWEEFFFRVKDITQRYRDENLTGFRVEFEEMMTILDKSFSGSTLAQQEYHYFATLSEATKADERIERARTLVDQTRGDLDHRKLLDLLIDEKEDKFIELVEGTRSHIAAIDGYLKRLAIALEDDFKVQFYDPAFVRIRDAAREYDVNLGQVERTTILTNNRAFAKVSPQATMEFDLPKRQIAIKEAFDAAKALVEDTGALVNDPTFLAAFQMMGGSQQPATVKNTLPGLPSSTDQQTLGLAPQAASGGPGSALQSLVPEPSIFKLETGTGFEIRPVIQPDGDAIIYDFNYMYTTNIREPVRADEKHLGRVKRHFVHTEVQTSSFELREISRYSVALKVSRTSRGVPLLEDIPILGAAFRPAPSAESSIQQNIILGQTTVYPTLFDLMGLRWAPYVVDLDHIGLLDAEHIIRGRRQSMQDYVFDVASQRVDKFLKVRDQTPEHYRPDLYHRHTYPSPNHPGGYEYPYARRDPTGEGYERTDRRPPEMQEPPYELYRHRPANPERIPARVPQLSPPLDQGGHLRTQFDSRQVVPAGVTSPDDPARVNKAGWVSTPSVESDAVRAVGSEGNRHFEGYRIRRLPRVN